MGDNLILHSTLQALKAASGQSGSATGPGTSATKVKDLAQQFEGLLLLQMVQQMQQSASGIDGEGAGSGNGGLMAGMGTMSSTMNLAFAMQLSKYGGFGLSKELLGSLDQQIPGASSAASQAADAVAGTGLRMGPAANGAEAAGAVNIGTTVPLASPDPGAVDVGTPVPIKPPAGVTVPAAPAPGDATGPDGAGAAAVDAVSGPITPVADVSELPDLSRILAAPVNSPFGWRRDPFTGQPRFHYGVDLRAAYGQPVPVAGAGKVVFAGNDGGYGLMVLVAHPGGLETRYAHLSSLDVQKGQEVEAGQVLGRVGETGRATGPHLHFEVIENGKRVNPEAVGLELAQFKSAMANAD